EEEAAWAWLRARAAGDAPPRPALRTRSARRMLALHGPVASAERIVVAQIGQTLDGRIATRSGHAHYVTGPEDLVRLHRLRALVDAVVVGAGTVAADDPRLTVRRVDGRNPVRVVLDPRGRLDPVRRVFTDATAPTLWVRASGPAALEEPPAGSSEVVHLPLEADGRFSPVRLLEHLEIGRAHV